jgi:hypothetical protein
LEWRTVAAALEKGTSLTRFVPKYKHDLIVCQETVQRKSKRINDKNGEAHTPYAQKHYVIVHRLANIAQNITRLFSEALFCFVQILSNLYRNSIV